MPRFGRGIVSVLDMVQDLIPVGRALAPHLPHRRRDEAEEAIHGADHPAQCEDAMRLIAHMQRCHRHTLPLQPLRIETAFAAKRIVSAGQHERRRRAGKAGGAERRGAPIVAVGRYWHVTVRKDAHGRRRERHPVCNRVVALASHAKVDARVEQNLVGDPRPLPIPSHQGQRRGEVAARAVTTDREAVRIDTKNGSIRHDPSQGSEAVFDSGWERVLRGKPVVDRDDPAPR